MARTKQYDFLIVGAGLFGCTMAYELNKAGFKCLVIDRLPHVGGNCYTENIEGINVHKYGPHIFHTHEKYVWDYINQFAEFNNFVNSPIANYKGQLYNLPFNMNTFWQLFGFRTPKEVEDFLATTKVYEEPQNLEEQAINLVGQVVYERFIKGYTEKQWLRPCTELSPSIIKRLPVRLTYDNNYFNDRYQGIPIGGYTQIFDKMLNGIHLLLGVEFNNSFDNVADKIIWTGSVDEYFNYDLGSLDYIGRRFESEILSESNHQGVAVMNYTDTVTSHLRTIEHKHFEFGTQPKTVITKEYSRKSNTPFDRSYPVDDRKNLELYDRYIQRFKKVDHVIPCGRLGSYKYYDMDDTIMAALRLVKFLQKS